jgi:hypothetical protein
MTRASDSDMPSRVRRWIRPVPSRSRATVSLRRHAIAFEQGDDLLDGRAAAAVGVAAPDRDRVAAASDQLVHFGDLVVFPATVSGCDGVVDSAGPRQQMGELSPIGHARFLS